MNWETELPKMKLFLSNENYDELLKYYKKGHTLMDYKTRTIKPDINAPVFSELTVTMLNNTRVYQIALTFIKRSDESEEK